MCCAMLYVVLCCAMLRCAVPCSKPTCPPFPHFRPTPHTDEPPAPTHPTNKTDPYLVHTHTHGLQRKQCAELGKRDGVGGGASLIQGAEHKFDIGGGGSHNTSTNADPLLILDGVAPKSKAL